MVSPFEKEYKLSKLIKQGKASIPAILRPLAEWIDRKYGVKTLNIIYDYVDKDVDRPLLSVILEYGNDKQKFYTEGRPYLDSEKQK